MAHGGTNGGSEAIPVLTSVSNQTGFSELAGGADS
jgi:hypothetical protein